MRTKNHKLNNFIEFDTIYSIYKVEINNTILISTQTSGLIFFNKDNFHIENTLDKFKVYGKEAIDFINKGRTMVFYDKEIYFYDLKYKEIVSIIEFKEKIEDIGNVCAIKALKNVDIIFGTLEGNIFLLKSNLELDFNFKNCFGPMTVYSILDLENGQILTCARQNCILYYDYLNSKFNRNVKKYIRCEWDDFHNCFYNRIIPNY